MEKNRVLISTWYTTVPKVKGEEFLGNVTQGHH